MTKFYVDNLITALRGSVVRRVFGTHERIVVFGSEHGEYSNTINFRFIEYISESSRPYCLYNSQTFCVKVEHMALLPIHLPLDCN